MKLNRYIFAKASAAFIGVVLAHGAQADTVIDFDSFPAGQGHNANLIQSFGDNAGASSEGVTVTGFGTPNIGLTWQGVGGSWQYYIDSVWSAGQLDSSGVGDQHNLEFAPNNAGAAVVIKSLNFHPYYVSSERYTYDWAVLSGQTVLASGSTTFLADATKNHPVEINYTGAAGATLTLQLLRAASTLVGGETEGGTQNIAVDDIVFAQVPEMELDSGPVVVSVVPSDGQIGVRPDRFFEATIADGTLTPVESSVELKFDGVVVTPAPLVTKANGLTTVAYQLDDLLDAGSTHQFTLTFEDDGVPATKYTNEVSYTVADYVNRLLPAPFIFEDFDSTPEGSLPAGWSAVSFTDFDAFSEPNINFTNLDSAAYTNWTVVEASRFTGTFETYSHLWLFEVQPEGEANDYKRVLTPNPLNVVNGAFVKDLATGRFAFSSSAYRLGVFGQIMYLFTPDFDLTGRSDVFLSFHSLWEQNQDSIAAVEYSIDMGATWLPIVYMLAAADVLTNPDGTVDAVTTLTTSYDDVPIFEGDEDGLGEYGAFIAVAPSEWPNLGPFISPRVDDNPSESKRVELFRLPMADGQANVRFRFAHAGLDSWYFGVDNFGLYSIELVDPPAVTLADRTAAIGNSVTFSAVVDGLGPFTYQWRFDGADIPGATAATYSIATVGPANDGAYSVVVSNDGGATESTATLTVFSSFASVTGQWDFESGDLSATCGLPLEYFDAAAEAVTAFGTTTSFGIPNINGQPSGVMQFSPVGVFGGYIMRHGIFGNGGGTFVNQYTLIMDLYWPAASDLQWRSLWQTASGNGNDGDFFINTANGIGISGVYEGVVTSGAWHRIALAVDLSGPGASPVVAKFIDGVKVGQQTLGSGTDGRWSLYPADDAGTPFALLFADESGDVATGYASSVQIRDGRLNDAAIVAMGGPAASGIPGAICLVGDGNNIAIYWSGTALEAAPGVNGPWSEVVGAGRPYTVPQPVSGLQFYRSR